MMKSVPTKVRLIMACAILITTVLMGGCSDAAMEQQQSSSSSDAVTGGTALAVSVSPAPAVSLPPTAAVTPSPSPTIAATAGATPTGPDESVEPDTNGGDADIAAPGDAMTAEAAAAAMEARVMGFMVTADRYYNKSGFSSNHYNYSRDDVKMLAAVIYLEARGETYKAKVAVANVVMNRVLASGYPGSTIREVVTAPNQFCYSSSVEPDAQCLRAAREVLQYETWVVPQNTYFFRATGSTGNWGSHQYYKHIDSIAFYRETYAGRSNGSAIPARLFKRIYKWPRYGCEPGTRVHEIQTMLSALGYETDTDGYFGEETRKQVIQFQKDHGLKADGIAGPATLTKLIGLYSGGND